MTTHHRRVSPADKRARHVAAVADTLTGCMLEDIDPRRVRLGDQKASAVVGEPMHPGRAPSTRLPKPGPSGYYHLNEIIQFLQACHAGVWRDAVEVAGRREWGRFEARCRARRVCRRVTA